MNDEQQRALLKDLIKAINEVADEHDAPPREKLGAIAALGNRASSGEWFTPEGDE